MAWALLKGPFERPTKEEQGAIERRRRDRGGCRWRGDGSSVGLVSDGRPHSRGKGIPRGLKGWEVDQPSASRCNRGSRKRGSRCDGLQSSLRSRQESWESNPGVPRSWAIWISLLSQGFLRASRKSKVQANGLDPSRANFDGGDGNGVSSQIQKVQERRLLHV